MESEVDVHKLQLLNDRIEQVIEALEQVRFAAHLQQASHLRRESGEPAFTARRVARLSTSELVDPRY
jgi:hypothetical protein